MTERRYDSRLQGRKSVHGLSDPAMVERRTRVVAAMTDERPEWVGLLIESRRAQGISQRTLAAIMGTSAGRVAAVERGDQHLRYDFLIRWLAALGLRMDTTLIRDDSEGPQGAGDA